MILNQLNLALVHLLRGWWDMRERQLCESCTAAQEVATNVLSGPSLSMSQVPSEGRKV